MDPLSTELRNKYDNLQSIIRSYKKVAVAFSGGLDSGFVLFAALKTLGRENILAVTADSESLARDELSCAERFAKQLGIEDRHHSIKTREIENPDYAANPSNRCFFCKIETHKRIGEYALSRGFDIIVDGSNASDIGDHRPGREAAKRLGVRSPLQEADLSKDEIREIAKLEGLQIWDKPQSACLASRVPYGERITPEKLAMIEAAEKYLRELGLKQFRVRHHGHIARIEVEEGDIGRLLDRSVRDKINSEFRNIGFTWVAVDLKPFESGSLNVLLNTEDGTDDG